jgi:hypothetical protein
MNAARMTLTSSKIEVSGMTLFAGSCKKPLIFVIVHAMNYLQSDFAKTNRESQGRSTNSTILGPCRPHNRH